MRGLYVDYEGGLVRVPGEIGERETRELIGRVSESLDLAETALADAGVPAFLRALSKTDLTEMLRSVLLTVEADI